MWTLARSVAIAIILGAATQVAEAARVQASFWVSPKGSDANPGTRAKPFATIERARGAARHVNGNMMQDIVVVLRGGTYQLTETLRLDARDSGTNGHDVIYRAYPGETPVISGGRQIVGWAEDADGH